MPVPIFINFCKPEMIVLIEEFVVPVSIVPVPACKTTGRLESVVSPVNCSVLVPVKVSVPPEPSAILLALAMERAPAPI